MDASTVVALLANAGALPKTETWRLDFGDDEQDAYGKAVDLLDSLGLIRSVDVNRIGEPYEILKVEGGLEISGPRGLLLATGREIMAPTEALAEAIVGGPAPVVSEREAEALVTWARKRIEAARGEQVFPGAPNETMGEKAARLVLAVLVDDPENAGDVIQMPRRLRAVEEVQS